MRQALPLGRSDMPAAPSSGDVAAIERRVASALKLFGERILPLEKASAESEYRHKQVMGKLDDLSLQVQKQGDKADLVNDRCDDLNTRVCVIERAWNEQMRPGLERLRNLELKVAGAAAVGGLGAAAVIELVQAVLSK